MYEKNKKKTNQKTLENQNTVNELIWVSRSDVSTLQEYFSWGRAEQI